MGASLQISPVAAHGILPPESVTAPPHPAEWNSSGASTDMLDTLPATALIGTLGAAITTADCAHRAYIETETAAALPGSA